MSFELLVQFLVLAATAALFWVARRDLASRPAPPAAPAETGELEQLCATLESLVTDMARRLATVERQVAAVERQTDAAAWGSGHRAAQPGLPAGSADLSVGPAAPPFPSVGTEETAAAPPDARYAPVYALLGEGLADPDEIARRTGLGRGEVDLILSLRARRAL